MTQIQIRRVIYEFFLKQTLCFVEKFSKHLESSQYALINRDWATSRKIRPIVANSKKKAVIIFRDQVCCINKFTRNVCEKEI